MIAERPLAAYIRVSWRYCKHKVPSSESFRDNLFKSWPRKEPTWSLRYNMEVDGITDLAVTDIGLHGTDP
jgi:hypothetical protein